MKMQDGVIAPGHCDLPSASTSVFTITLEKRRHNPHFSLKLFCPK